MLPLAILLKGMGYTVSGSDRSYDQGRTPEKFTWIKAQGIDLFPQDGSGISGIIHEVLISKAVEDTVPDIAAAKRQGIPIRKRVDMLIDLFNAADKRIAVSGTSGKTTTTGMIAYLLKEAGLDPTVNNGGIFKNYIEENPYSTAFVGKGHIFVSEIDESDGIEAVCRFEPDIAVIHNISLDHQPMEELQKMFAGFLSKTSCAIVNAEDEGVMGMAKGFTGKIISYGVGIDGADLSAHTLQPRPDGIDCTLEGFGEKTQLKLSVPGQHNVSNALAAVSVGIALGLTLQKCADILSRFEGIKRRMDVIGTTRNITVIDDFAHNPDKIDATLHTLKEFPGRLLIFFQPHGYGFLKVVACELAQSFIKGMSPEDRVYTVEPFYTGGTVDRSVQMRDVVAMMEQGNIHVLLFQNRAEVEKAILADAQPQDRIVIMGARDDSLTTFAQDVHRRLGE